MRILAFETSAKAASVALLEDGRLLAESYQNTGLTHSQTLMVMAQDLLNQLTMTPGFPSAMPWAVLRPQIIRGSPCGHCWKRRIRTCMRING